MRILVLNAGSSSLKYRLFRVSDGWEEVLARAVFVTVGAAHCDFLPEAVTRGKVLVAIEDEHPGTARLATAERIFYEAGAEPLPLRE